MFERVEIWTDGACSPNPGPGGWAAIVKWSGHSLELCGHADMTTNNRMELLACVEGLQSLDGPCAVTLYTDSLYVKNGITAWIKKWKANGWRTADKQPVKNKLLWEQLDALQSRHAVTWKWVKGHSGNGMNARADELAQRASGTWREDARAPEVLHKTWNTR